MDDASHCLSIDTANFISIYFDSIQPYFIFRGLKEAERSRGALTGNFRIFQGNGAVIFLFHLPLGY
jgi:hypothetical protein